MTKESPLKTLIGLAQDDVDTAAQRLGRLQRERGEAEAQLQALITYRDEYHARFTESARAGMAAGSVRNFQAFIDTLDAAIGQQQRMLEQADARLEAAKPEWRRQKQKLGSYEVLQARSEATEARKSARREQRDADEHAARVLRMRASNP
ncbi:flagellar export protein FliJ [Paraburkholderia caballeronis]|uniref:Flagellar FliJ protein n=1 Tax=Paraburkholderia caballeronis TaxID=416943 RepID=A0A1H7SKX2_9BURK|nr:flagellar export protein FliJ [Paraburkholderia caballeronis]PXW22357.1 flagellar FliJ protein [Paraburkholderia caballeronis]PXW96015.1 flagellar FliJ protein [Paraburkholderia caballeronis]RAJ92381.1 flagellar FliJ protein [Paraburkholderia caballeronis]TDV08074.1 flagellar FliJ protein [Paraburkholderia caballeronis]TDV11862.1 flagellar FliJ protein [Paraburkholderia caballeronis]